MRSLSSVLIQSQAFIASTPESTGNYNPIPCYLYGLIQYMMFDMISIPAVQRINDTASANLSVLEFTDLPWQPKRIYWINDFVPTTTRGNHAHKVLEQVFILLAGSLTLEVFHGTASSKVELSKFSDPLFVPKMTWRVISNASSDAVCMVLANMPYSDDDYIRDWEQYLVLYKEMILNRKD